MNISNLTSGQKKGIYEMLNGSTSLTPSESKALRDLKLFFGDVVTTDFKLDFEVSKNGKKVRAINLDTFGEDYRNNWLSVKEDSKGFFIRMSYFKCEDNKSGRLTLNF